MLTHTNANSKFKIKRINIYKFNRRLPKSFAISFRTWDHVENVLLSVETDRGITGYGDASPVIEITGDTQETALKFLTNVKSSLIGQDPCDISAIHNLLEQASNKLGFNSQTSKAAIDYACYDILGKFESKPIYQLLGCDRPRIAETSIGIGIASTAEIVENAKELMSVFKEGGPWSVKLKLSGDPKADKERVLAVADVFAGKLKFDPNQAYHDPKVAVSTFNELHSSLGSRVLLVEQPTPKGELDKLKYVSDNCEIPIFADESAATIEDIQRVVEKKAAKGVNIKLQKIGGIYWARKAAELLRESGIALQIGCMYETAIGIAAGANFVAGTPSVSNSDLDGDFNVDLYSSTDISTEDTRPSVRYGARMPSGKPGLGIRLRDCVGQIMSGEVCLEQIV